MSPERQPVGAHRRWSLRPTWGEAAFAAVAVAVVSGAALAVGYDVQRPYDSIAVLLLANPGAAFFRNLHYWAGQAFLVLTLAHAWDHLSRWTETRVPRTVWWRVAASLPLAVYLMLSGFMLKGDADAQQALRLVTALLEQVPGVGRLLAVALFGTEGNRQILYVHHVATASIFTWLFVAEHARAYWPRLTAVVEGIAPLAVIALFVSPALHDGLDPVVKGPWFFLGLQEILHWTSQPVWVVVAASLIVGLLAVLPRTAERRARVVKWVLALALAGYAGLTIVGVWFRGENWSAVLPWTRAPGLSRTTGLVFHGIGRWWGPSADAILAHDIPVVLGRREGCLFCHAGTKGLSRAHGAEAVGCASCHRGDPFSLHAPTAHAGLVRIPGNLATAARDCGTAECHPSQVNRVSRSLMATMAGIVSVDRAVWSGRPSDGEAPRVDGLGRLGADGHLRQLCASCHLGGAKESYGPIAEDARGGGCNACHLKYSREALAALSRRTADPARWHPDVSIAIDRGSCFGCHSRSGRISTNYEGWHEMDDRGSAGPRHDSGDPRHTRRLADGRTFVFVAPDVHARSMDCIDCHTSQEVMGDGVTRGRAHEAVRVACLDCHRPRVGAPADASTTANVVGFDALDSESRRIAELRGRGRREERFLSTARGGYPLLGTLIDGNGAAWQVAKASGSRLPLNAPAAVCLEGAGHARLSCVSCHAAWAPRCPRCHTAFDPGREAVDLLDGRPTKGAWVETPGEFQAVPPTLGVRSTAPGERIREEVDTFIPGMVMTLARNQAVGGRPDTVFRRLYARSFSHTVGKSARSCQSCHADPVALGYGEGALRFERTGDHGRWTFAPRFGPGPDGLPADAWIGFLQERTSATSTRPDVRPFSAEEQKRILTVGACLTCHEPARLPVAGFKATLARMSRKCAAPRW